MRAVIQRVTKASVTGIMQTMYMQLASLNLTIGILVDEKIVGSIQKGVCVLLGIATDDTDKDVDYMVNKILNVRIFDENGAMWKKGVKDAGLELLCGNCA